MLGKRQEINEEMVPLVEDGQDYLGTVNICHDIVIVLWSHEFETVQSESIL